MKKLPHRARPGAFHACFDARAGLHPNRPVVRLVRDRYFAFDRIHGCDLMTGDEVRLDSLPDEASPGDGPPHLVEVLASAQDGAPRWLVAGARNSSQAATMGRHAAAEARRRGFVPVLVPLYERFRRDLAEELQERTLLLIGSFAGHVDAARTALVAAAAQSPRPHILLTFAAASAPRDDMVCEARTAYSSLPDRRGAIPRTDPESARYLARAMRAAEFQRAGRHAAAERLLRDVSAALIRRAAWGSAASTLIVLGRMLVERGRASAAEKIFGEAAALAESAKDGVQMVDARLWQATARIDAGRLTDAESLCRAVLVTGGQDASRTSWAQAILGRILLWQGRVDEACRLTIARPETAPDDLGGEISATVDATASRVLLAGGDVFHAGLRVRALLTRVEGSTDLVTRVIALTAHLRVVVAAGDLVLAESILHEIASFARQGRTPLRAARARMIWYDALCRAGRLREATHQLNRLARMCRVAPASLRGAIEQRIASSPPGGAAVVPPAMIGPWPRGPSIASELVRLAHDEENDARAVQRLVERIARTLQTNRVEVLSADAGPVSTLVTAGCGLPTHLGPRVLDAGIVLPREVQRGGYEIGIPIRCGGTLWGALVCRWPLDREPVPDAIAVMELAGAIAAPRVEALLSARRDAARAATSIPELVGASALMADVRRAIERAARAPFAVLVEGESGVGKELAARAIHQLSPRRDRRFCDVNCAALPDELLESELFGHARGAFTGAVADKAGLFEEADGGTLFLDEMPDLSSRGQAKLLRVLQQNEVRRVGETFSRKIDVRLVTAANRDMRAEASEQRFRADLLYRLDVIRIRIPPLRERPEDIAVLAQHFWRACAPRVGSTAVLSHGVLADLSRYHWPGNVRELQNVVAALAVAAPGRGQVRSSLLPSAITSAASVTSHRLAEARTQFERRCVEIALARAGGSRTRAAAELGLSRQGLLKMMARLGIEPAPPASVSNAR